MAIELSSYVRYSGEKLNVLRIQILWFLGVPKLPKCSNPGYKVVYLYNSSKCEWVKINA